MVQKEGTGGGEGKIRKEEGLAVHQIYALWIKRQDANRVFKINDENGRPYETTIDQQKRRRGHFSRVLTIHSQCNATEVARVKQK